MGESTDPCGTPAEDGWGDEEAALDITWKVRLWRKDRTMAMSMGFEVRWESLSRLGVGIELAGTMVEIS